MTGIAENKSMRGRVARRAMLLARLKTRRGFSLTRHMRPATWLLVALFSVCALLSGISSAQDQVVRLSKEDSSLPIPYDPPNEQQIKIEIKYGHFDRAEGRFIYKNARINQFPVTGGEPTLTAETPECTSDYHLDEIISTNSLKVRAGKGSLFLEGVGFLFRQTNTSLVVSNQVHSVLLLRTTTNALASRDVTGDINYYLHVAGEKLLAATEITSRRGEFEMKTDATNGMALYLGNVRVLDPQMTLLCEWLKADLPKSEPGQTNRPNHIVARTNVVIDFINANGKKIHALGNQAVYDYRMAGTTTNEMLELTGTPRVNLTSGWMTADVFVMDRASGKLSGRGNFHFHYHPTNQPTETEIVSDQFDFDINTRLAHFFGHVNASDPRLKLTSDYLAATLPKQNAGAANHLDHILAETNVMLDIPLSATNRQSAHATGQKAVYDFKVVSGVTNQMLELTGNPVVQTDKGWMSADLIKMDLAQGRIWGNGNHHSVIKKMPGEPATMDTEVFSDRFEYSNTNGLAIYRDNVRAFDPEMNLTQAGRLSIELARDTKGATNLHRLVAEGNVALDFVGKAFAADDITNLTALATSLKEPRDGVAQFVRAQLASATQTQLANYTNGINASLQRALAFDLNHLTQNGPLYDSARFTNIYLSLATSQLMKQHLLGLDLIQLNRLLLLDAFRGSLARGRLGEKTHATCEVAAFTNQGTNAAASALVELSGQPKLYNPSGWVEADESIIYDRATGVCHYLGHPSWHPNLQGLVKTSAKKETK